MPVGLEEDWVICPRDVERIDKYASKPDVRHLTNVPNHSYTLYVSLLHFSADI